MIQKWMNTSNIYKNEKVKISNTNLNAHKNTTNTLTWYLKKYVNRESGDQ